MFKIMHVLCRSGLTCFWMFPILQSLSTGMPETVKEARSSSKVHQIYVKIFHNTTLHICIYIGGKSLHHTNEFCRSDMEIIDDDAEKANIQFVKINDKRLGKSFGIKKFPALTMIR